MTETTDHGAGGSTPPQPGWWLASDGNWYPPHQASGVAPPPPQAYGQHLQVPESNGMATAAMVVGIIAVLTFWFGLGLLLGIVAFVLGIVSLRRANELPNGAGRGQAITGIVTGTIGVLGLIMIVAIAFLGESAEQEFREVGEELDSDFGSDFDSDFGGDGINTDPSDGWCNDDRYMQDPDC